MMTDFAAIDFEIANYHRSSVCSVGVVVVWGFIAQSSTAYGCGALRVRFDSSSRIGRCGGMCGDCDEGVLSFYPILFQKDSFFDYLCCNKQANGTKSEKADSRESGGKNFKE